MTKVISSMFTRVLATCALLGSSSGDVLKSTNKNYSANRDTVLEYCSSRVSETANNYTEEGKILCGITVLENVPIPGPGKDFSGSAIVRLKKAVSENHTTFVLFEEELEHIDTMKLSDLAPEGWKCTYENFNSVCTDGKRTISRMFRSENSYYSEEELDLFETWFSHDESEDIHGRQLLNYKYLDIQATHFATSYTLPHNPYFRWYIPGQNGDWKTDFEDCLSYNHNDWCVFGAGGTATMKGRWSRTRRSPTAIMELSNYHSGKGWSSPTGLTLTPFDGDDTYTFTGNANIYTSSGTGLVIAPQGTTASTAAWWVSYDQN